MNASTPSTHTRTRTRTHTHTHHPVSFELQMSTLVSRPLVLYSQHVDDDVLVHVPNLARFLSAFDADLPLWFSAHGCDASYVPSGSSVPPCVAQSPPRGCIGCDGVHTASGLRKACEAAGSPFVTRDQEYASHMQMTADGRHAMKIGKGWRGGCAARPWQQGLRTFGAEVGQSYCGGTGCVFSRGYLGAFPHAEIFRNRTACQGCTRGQQDVALSRCLFHHNPLGIAPIGIPGFFWGRPGERLVEQWLDEVPRCLQKDRNGRPGGEREGTCVRRHGMMEWFTMHLQVRSVHALQEPHACGLGLDVSSRRSGGPVPNLPRRSYQLATSPSMPRRRSAARGLAACAAASCGKTSCSATWGARRGAYSAAMPPPPPRRM